MNVDDFFLTRWLVGHENNSAHEKYHYDIPTIFTQKLIMNSPRKMNEDEFSWLGFLVTKTTVYSSYTKNTLMTSPRFLTQRRRWTKERTKTFGDATETALYLFYEYQFCCWYLQLYSSDCIHSFWDQSSIIRRRRSNIDMLILSYIAVRNNNVSDDVFFFSCEFNSIAC